jgi:hypothetical protein
MRFFTPIMPFGKYKGLSLQQIANRDPLYLKWLYTRREIKGPLRDRIKECYKKNKEKILEENEKIFYGLPEEF